MVLGDIARRALEKVPSVLRPQHEGGFTGGHRLESGLLPSHRLRVMSFNMQAGIGVNQYRQYVTRSWRHVLPSLGSRSHLHEISRLIHHSDIVALQEVDGGSLRSGFINQLHHLAHDAGFPYCYQQLNRDLGRFGQYTNGLLSRFTPYEVEQHSLPGLKGRGAIMARYGSPDETLLVINLHLALSVRGRNRQLEYVRDLMGDARHVILMGDLNCTHEELLGSPLGDGSWQWTYGDLNTFPSWRPAKRLDHILVSSSLRIHQVRVIDSQLSDHRPVVMDLELPASFPVSASL